MAHAARQQGFSLPVTPNISWLAKATRVIAKWRRRARERQMLGRLNDHYLHDIGLNRHDVMIETTKPFWRP